MSTTPHFLREFPNFDGADVFERLLAAGWEDDSWHNDTCPSVMHASGSVKLWVEWELRAMRETGSPRFCAQGLGVLDDEWIDIAAGEDLDAVLAEVERHLQAQARQFGGAQ